PPPHDRNVRGTEQLPGQGRRDPDGDNPPARPTDDLRPSAERPAAEAAPGVAEPVGSFSDWRETLRAAGGGPPGPVTPPPAGGGRSGAGAAGSGDSVTAGGSGGENLEENEMARAKKASRVAEESADDAPSAAAARSKADTGPAPRPAGRATVSTTATSGQTATLPAWAAALDIPAGLSVGKAAALDDTFANLRTLDELARVTEKCTRCDLYRTATHAVPGEGNADADLVCVGEAPGANEDASGRPFVGAAGQLLTKILAAINLSRDDVFICNVLKHRPPGNRNPAPDEVEACSPYLLRQLELVKPKVILTLGTFAAQTLLATKTPIGKLRGQVHLYHGIPLVVTYHPAALLRNSAWKRPTWEDVQLARRLLDRAPGA
ncbi:MAG: uracil-DNA glycosylase, partial [Gemmatimonadaceae bacterium]